MIAEQDLIWLAGFIDGTARIYPSASKGKRGDSICLDIRLKKDLPGIENLENLLGERSVQVQASGLRKLCKEHCPEPHVHVTGSESYYQRFSGAAAYVVLWNLFPYLRLKRDLALEAMDRYLKNPASLNYRSGRAANPLYALGWQEPDDMPYRKGVA